MKNITLKKVLIVALIVLGVITLAGVVYMAYFDFIGIVAVASGVGGAIPVLCELARTDKAINKEKEEKQE